MKRVLIVATGGTIASAKSLEGSLEPTLTGEDLTHCVPEIAELCDCDVVQTMNIDSTNMRPRDWMRIRDAIVDAYDAYDGFVILHGTDTMAYTAAALSYLIQNSPKPIVLTGSQQPMTSPFTDARINLYQSVLYALDPRSHDVCVVFGGEVIAGTRARKQRTMSFNAFTSVNYPPIALIRNNRVVRVAGDPLPASSELRTFRSLDERVFVLKLTPEMSPRIFELLKPHYDAIIVETFGIGGIPAYEDGSYEKAISDWIDSGRTLVVTTQVPEEGCDLGVYEVGRVYADNPVILKGDDMTTEALVAKTMWVLGQSRDPKKIAHLFYQVINHDRLEIG